MATIAGTGSEAEAVSVEANAVPQAAAEGGGLGFGTVVAGITAIVAPVTLITSIAFYFGYVHTDAWARYFGLDPSVLGYTTRDYVLASLRPLFLPVVTVLIVLIAVALVHAYVDRTLESDLAKHYSLLWKAAVSVGIALLVSGAIAVSGTVSTQYLFGTLAPAAGVILVTYGISLRRRLHGQPRLPASTQILVALLALLSFFWAAGIYAGNVGRATAADLAKHLKQLPGAVLYSQKDLDIPSGYGVRVFHLSPSSEFPVAYSGLRLLERSDGKFFLLPRWWTPRDGAMAIVLPESDTWRIALVPGVHVKSSLSIALGGGLVGAAAPAVKAAGAEEVRSRALEITFLHASEEDVAVRNRLDHRIGPLLVRGRLSGAATPVVKIDNGHCAVDGRRFVCRTRGLGPHGSLTVRITEAHGRSAGGSVLVRFGRHTYRSQIEIDSR